MQFTRPLLGKPNEILDTPSTVWRPNCVLTILTAFNVSITAACSADAVSVRQSMKMFSFGIPISKALFIIFFAISNLFSAFGGIPSLSSVRPTTAAPYFLTIGNTFFSDSSSPFTEFTIALPLYTLKAASRTSGIVESNCNGRFVTPCNAFTVLIIISFSSIPGRPTFTSRISAPPCACSIACPKM